MIIQFSPFTRFVSTSTNMVSTLRVAEVDYTVIMIIN